MHAHHIVPEAAARVLLAGVTVACRVVVHVRAYYAELSVQRKCMAQWMITLAHHDVLHRVHVLVHAYTYSRSAGCTFDVHMVRATLAFKRLASTKITLHALRAMAGRVAGLGPP